MQFYYIAAAILGILGFVVIEIKIIKNENERNKETVIIAPKIDALRKEKNYSEALKLLDQLISKFPDDYDLTVRKEILEVEANGGSWQINDKDSRAQRLFEI